MPSVRSLVAIVLLLPGCVGSGDGWVTGSVVLSQCTDDGGLAESGTFDLDVDFFSGEVLEDRNEYVPARQSSLVVRLQDSSTTVEVSNGLMLQFRDTARAAQHFAAGQLLPVTDSSLCATGCPLGNDLVRGRLYLFSRCPQAREGLIATSRGLPAATTGCVVPPSEDNPAACSDLGADARASLDALCAGDFNNRDGAETLRSALGAGGSSCVYLCQFGDAQHGAAADSFAGYTLDYGDRVAALFSLSLVDGRAIRSATCAQGLGQVQGMFNFVVRRGVSAQAFP